jgi:hypothetical protein
MNSIRNIIDLKKYLLFPLFVSLVSICNVNGQDFTRDELFRRINNSAFTAVIEVKDGKRQIRDVIVGDIQKFKFLENGQVSNPDRDRIYLIILDTEMGDSERLILAVRDGIIRFGIKKMDTETVRNLIIHFRKNVP